MKGEKDRIKKALALLRPKDSRDTKMLITALRDAISQIEQARSRVSYDLSHADKMNLRRYRAALVRADAIFPKLHRIPTVILSAPADGKLSKTLTFYNHKKQIASIDRLLKEPPRPKHRNEADKYVAKDQAKLILSRVGRRCSVDALAAALYGTAASLRNIKSKPPR